MLNKIFCGLKCSECPFITCNYHPMFYLAKQCAVARNQKEQQSTKKTSKK